MAKRKNRWTRLSDELEQRRGIERANKYARRDAVPAQLPEPGPPPGRVTARRRPGR